MDWHKPGCLAPRETRSCHWSSSSQTACGTRRWPEETISLGSMMCSPWTCRPWRVWARGRRRWRGRARPRPRWWPCSPWLSPAGACSSRGASSAADCSPGDKVYDTGRMTTYRYDVLVLLQTEHDIIVTAWKQLRDGVTVHLMPHLHRTEILAKHVMSTSILLYWCTWFLIEFRAAPLAALGLEILAGDTASTWEKGVTTT